MWTAATREAARNRMKEYWAVRKQQQAESVKEDKKKKVKPAVSRRPPKKAEKPTDRVSIPRSDLACIQSALECHAASLELVLRLKEDKDVVIDRNQIGKMCKDLIKWSKLINSLMEIYNADELRKGKNPKRKDV